MGTSNKKVISGYNTVSCPAEGKMPHPFPLLSKYLSFFCQGAEYTQDLINLGTVLDIFTGYWQFSNNFTWLIL